MMNIMRVGLKITEYRLMVSLFMLTFFAMFTISCTHIAYSGPELPDSEIAIIKSYYRYYFFTDEDCTFYSVDGHHLGVIYTIKATPGQHWMEISIFRGSGNLGGQHVPEVCAFDLDVKAGLKYQIKPHSLTRGQGAPPLWQSRSNSSRSLYNGSLVIEVTKPEGGQEMQIVKTTCHLGGANLCRKISDCGVKLDTRCIPQQGYDFGRCEF